MTPGPDRVRAERISRWRGILALERVAEHDPEAMASIRRMLGDPDAGVRRTALDIPADLQDKDAAAEVLPLLADPDPGVRREAEELNEVPDHLRRSMDALVHGIGGSR